MNLAAIDVKVFVPAPDFEVSKQSTQIMGSAEAAGCMTRCSEWILTELSPRGEAMRDSGCSSAALRIAQLTTVSSVTVYLLGERTIYRTRKEVQLALVRLSVALPSMLKDADTFHDQFERRAEAIIRGSPAEFEDYIYEHLREMVVVRGIKPRPADR